MFRFKTNQDETILESDDLLMLQQFAIRDHSDSESGESDKPVVYALPLNSSGNETKKNGDDHGKKSILEKNTIVAGPITSVTSIEIEGRVNGEVICENDVIVRGTVIGDIHASNVILLSGKVTGNINSQNSISLDIGAAVKGNIVAESLKCDGKIEGITKLKDTAVITCNAAIYGDISAKQVRIDQGAEIIGNMKISANDVAEPESNGILVLEDILLSNNK